MPKKIKTIIKKLRDNAEKEIAENSNGFYGQGLANEGYAGGYRDALDDVLNVMRGILPTGRFSKGLNIFREDGYE